MSVRVNIKSMNYEPRDVDGSDSRKWLQQIGVDVPEEGSIFNQPFYEALRLSVDMGADIRDIQPYFRMLMRIQDDDPTVYSELPALG